MIFNANLSTQMRRFSQEHIRRELQAFGRGDHLLLCLAGDYCPHADCHLLVSASETGLTTDFVVPDAKDPSRMVNNLTWFTCY